MEHGILYGVGVGPGDPELITLKASRLINETTYLAIPGELKENVYSYRIAEQIMDNPESKIIIGCPVQMTKDTNITEDNYRIASERIAEVLRQGENVVFLTIGDPTVYSTYMYIHRMVEEKGFKAEIINGIPSFCAAAARMGTSLCDRSEQLHIIPLSYDIENSLSEPGVKVLMKASKNLPEVKNKLKERDCSVFMVENCGMENEKIYKNLDEIDDNAGYLSVMVVRDKQ